MCYFIIPPHLLTDQLLGIEYRQICLTDTLFKNTHNCLGNRLFSAIKNSTPSHEIFFLDKGVYLKNRFDSLVEEMINRRIESWMAFDVDNWIPFTLNDWVPSNDDIELGISIVIDLLPHLPNRHTFSQHPVDHKYIVENLREMVKCYTKRVPE
jgi:hypothetical protein